MSRFDGRAADPGSYRDRRSEGAFGGGTRAFAPPSKADAAAAAAAAELDGLPRFEKNFYVESPAVAGMTEDEVEAYRRRREITVEGRDVPKPVRDFRDVGFPALAEPRWGKPGLQRRIPAISSGKFRRNSGSSPGKRSTRSPEPRLARAGWLRHCPPAISKEFQLDY